MTIDDLQRQPKRSPTLAAAEDFLLEKLAVGCQEVNVLLDQAKSFCSKRTLDEAKRNLRVKTTREGNGTNHKVYWSL